MRLCRAGIAVAYMPRRSSDGGVLCSKLRYYEKFVPPSMKRVALYGVYDDTQHDSDVHVYQCAPTCTHCALVAAISSLLWCPTMQ